MDDRLDFFSLQTKDRPWAATSGLHSKEFQRTSRDSHSLRIQLDYLFNNHIMIYFSLLMESQLHLSSDFPIEDHKLTPWRTRILFSLLI